MLATLDRNSPDSCSSGSGLLQGRSTTADIAAHADAALSAAQRPVVEGCLENQAIAIANRIQEDFLTEALLPGTVYGSELALSARYDVGRGTLREAIRILEFRGVARTRRGPKGGLLVGLPGSDLLGQSFTGHMLLAGATFEHLVEARTVIATIGVRLACREQSASVRQGPADKEGVRFDGLGIGLTLVSRIASMSSNPALAALTICIDALVAHTSKNRSGLFTSTAVLSLERTCTQGVIDAIAAADPNLGCQLISEYYRTLMACGRFDGAILGSDPANPQRIAVSEKRAGQIARNIIGDILRGSNLPGDRLGSEAELGRRYGISRAITRQAIRLLEDAGIANCRRGRGCGLYLKTPNPSSTIRAICLYLQSRVTTASQSWAIGQLLSVEIAKLAAGNPQASAVIAQNILLQEFVEVASSDATLDIPAIDGAVDEIGVNPILLLMLKSLKEYSRLVTHNRDVLLGKYAKACRAEYMECTRRVVNAILNGDRLAAEDAQKTKNSSLARFLAETDTAT